MENLFFALRPDAAAAQRAHALALRLRAVYGLTAQPLPLERLHVTLCFLGSYTSLPDGLQQRVDAAARALRAAPFELAFDRVMSFERGRGGAPLVLCRDDDCAPLSQLHNLLIAELARSSHVHPGAHGFKPHVTLLYDRKMVSLQQVAPISWTANELLLIRSLVGRGQHEVLARYPLLRA